MIARRRVAPAGAWRWSASAAIPALLLIGALAAPPLHAQVKSSLYIDGTIALSSGHWTEAAAKFRAILAADSRDERSMVGFGQAILGCYDKTSGCGEELTVAEGWLEKATSKPEHWELLGNVRARIAARVRGSGSLSEVSPQTLRQARSIWYQAIEAFDHGGASDGTQRAREHVAEINNYLEASFTRAAQPAVDLLASYRMGSIEPRESFDRAAAAVREAAEFLPGDERIAGFGSDLQAAQAGMSQRLQGQYAGELHGHHWAQARKLVQMVFDFDRDLRFRVRANQMAEDTLRPLVNEQLGKKEWQPAKDLCLELLRFSAGNDYARTNLALAETRLARINQLLRAMHLARSLKDHAGLLEAVRELETITPDPDFYHRLAISENDSIFNESLLRKDWANADSCIAFAKAYGQNPAPMRMHLYVTRHAILLVAIVGIVILLVVTTVILARRGRKAGVSRRSLARLKAALDKKEFDAVWAQLAGILESGSDTRRLDISEALLTMVAHPHFPSWEALDQRRLELMKLADDCIGKTTDAMHKVRLVCARFQLGFVEQLTLPGTDGKKQITWQSTLAMHREYRHELRVADAVWDVEFETLQGQGPTWVWWTEDVAQRNSMDTELTADVDDWLGDTTIRWEELENRFGRSFAHPCSRALRWRCGVEFLRHDWAAQAAPLLEEFLYDGVEPPVAEMHSEVLARWKACLMGLATMERRDLVFLREQLLARSAADDSHAVLARLYAELDRLAQAGEDPTVEALEPLGVAARLDSEGLVRLAGALRRRSGHAPSEQKLLQQALDAEFDIDIWYYLLDVLACTRGLVAVLHEIEARSSALAVDPVELEQQVERIVETAYAPDWAMAGAIFLPPRPLA